MTNGMPKNSGTSNIQVAIGCSATSDGVVLSISVGGCSVYQIALPWEALPGIESALAQAKASRPRITLVTTPEGLA